MSERKLAHIETISDLNPIPKADKIEVATVLGWQCIVGKGEFKIGDPVIYVEVDSLMPEREEFEFLRKRKFRIKTIQLLGQVSQGLILPLSILDKDIRDKCYVGLDVTKELGITKYLSPSELEEGLELNKKVANQKSKFMKFMMSYSWFRKLFLPKKVRKSGFPDWVSKTDEERIQNIPHVLEQFKDTEVYVTEKVDYQSATFTGKMLPNTTPIIGRFLPKKYKFIVCSRNMVNGDKNSLYWRIAQKYNLEKILRENPSLTIQGEQGDTKVQGNKYGITGPRLWVFNIIDHEREYQYNYEEMRNFCSKYNLECVPILAWMSRTTTIPLWRLGSTVKELVEYSEGKSVINPQVEREGIVVRSIKDGKKVLSFKVINPNFLLKHDA